MRRHAFAENFILLQYGLAAMEKIPYWHMYPTLFLLAFLVLSEQKEAAKKANAESKAELARRVPPPKPISTPRSRTHLEH